MAAESPLYTPEAKTNFLTHFDEFDENKKEKLTRVLIDAAINLHSFPESIAEDIEGFQHSLKKHSQNERIRRHQEESLEEYFQTEGTDKFLEATHSLADQRWPSTLLRFLSEKLKFEIKEEPIIEAKVKKNGKIAWRSIDLVGNPIEGGQKSKRCSDFKYNKAKCWRMTVADFRKFKDSGKRWGNQAITRERFIEYFGDNYHKLHAGEVWDELNETGILNKNHRISMQWRVLSNKSVTLNAVSSPMNIWTPTEIEDALKEIGGPAKKREYRQPVTKEIFVNYWKIPHREEAAHIWEILKRKKILDDQDHPTYSWSKECSKKIKKRQLTYSKICTALYEIANTPIPDQHFRPERTRRKWRGKEGLVQNDLQTQGQEVRILDVGIYLEHQTHEVTGDNTEHDHVTSDAILSHDQETKITELTQLIDEKKALIQEYEEDLESLEDEEEIEDLQNEIDKENENLVTTKRELHRTSYQHKENWWTIELPEDRHHRGLTYQVPSKKQLEIVKNPFLDEANHYLEEPKSSESQLKEIGAFRNLYRSQTRDHQPIQGHSPIGHFPFLFFQARPELKAKISGMFNQRVQEHISESDGVKKPKAARKLKF